MASFNLLLQQTPSARSSSCGWKNHTAHIGRQCKPHPSFKLNISESFSSPLPLGTNHLFGGGIQHNGHLRCRTCTHLFGTIDPLSFNPNRSVNCPRSKSTFLYQTSLAPSQTDQSQSRLGSAQAQGGFN